MSAQRVEVAVVGGGLAGWAAAAAAAQEGARVTVLDPRDDGGRAATDERDGFLLNRGAHALYLGGPGEATLGRLGVEPRGAAPDATGFRARLGDELHVLPVGAGSLLRTGLLGAREKAELAAVMSRAPRWDAAEVAHLSVTEWIGTVTRRRRLRHLLAALIRLGSYSADHDVVSADVAVTQLQAGLRGVLYVQGGWRTLVEGLRATAGHRAMHLPHRAVSVHPREDGVTISVGDDSSEGEIEASWVVLATGNPDSAAALLGSRPAEWTDLGPPAEVTCLDLGFDTEVESPLCLGVDEPLYSNRHDPPADLAPSGGSLVHVMRYLPHGEQWEPRRGRAVLEEHARVAGADPDRAVVSRYLHRMTVTAAQPVPRHGGMRGRPGTDSTGADRIAVAGDWVGPVGNLAEASLASGEEAGRAAARRARAATPALA